MGVGFFGGGDPFFSGDPVACGLVASPTHRHVGIRTASRAPPASTRASATHPSRAKGPTNFLCLSLERTSHFLLERYYGDCALETLIKILDSKNIGLGEYNLVYPPRKFAMFSF